VRDRLFTGTDVAEALAAAARTLGLPQRELRYVVLDVGRRGGMGLQPTLARVAVLLQEQAPARSRALPDPESSSRREEPGDVRAGIRGVVRSMAEAAGAELSCEMEEHESVLLVELRGPGCSAFYGEDAAGEPLRALEHLLLRMYGESLRPLGLRVRCEGFRERREVAIGERARRLAAEVRASGEAVELEPMNAYERRLVHIALQDEAGVGTHSVGEGSVRRVRIERVADQGGASDVPADEGRHAG
jgi:spoIIIJ-associated protein